MIKTEKATVQANVTGLAQQGDIKMSGNLIIALSFEDNELDHCISSNEVVYGTANLPIMVAAIKALKQAASNVMAKIEESCGEDVARGVAQELMEDALSELIK